MTHTPPDKLGTKLRYKYHLVTNRKRVPTNAKNISRLEKYAQEDDIITMSLVLCKGKVDWDSIK